MTPITRLSPLHAEEWHAFRLQSLKDHPQSFAASFEDEASLSIKEIQDFLGSPHNPIFAIIKEGAILSAAGLSLSMRKKRSHRGTLGSVYTVPSAQRQGYSQKVIQYALDYARTQEISQIYLSVHVENFPAIALYERLGFTAYGVEPKALCVQGQFLDLRLMHKSL